MLKCLEIEWTENNLIKGRHLQLVGNTEDFLWYYIDWDTTFDGRPIGDYPYRCSLLYITEHKFNNWRELHHFGDIETAQLFCSEHYKSFDKTQFIC